MAALCPEVLRASHACGKLGRTQPAAATMGWGVMNELVTDLLYEVVDKLKGDIQRKDCPAIVAIDGTKQLVIRDYDYLRDRETAVDFERRAATRARELDVVRWVLAVPQVWVIDARGGIKTRAVSNLPLREGEEEAITWTAYDRDDGLDIGRVFYTRRPSGAPIFDEPEIVTRQGQMSENAPGHVLLQSVIAADE